MPMLEYLDPSSQCFTCLIKIVLASCHLKNYFVITYLLEDEQELSLGMLICGEPRRSRLDKPRHHIWHKPNLDL